MSNTNEKAQSADYTLSEIAQANDYLYPIGRSDMFPVREAIGKGFIAGQRSMQSHISQLESELAKSQEKCSKYEGALEDIQAKSKTKPHFPNKRLSVVNNIAYQILNAKQYMKPGIKIDETELSESNFTEFMSVLDTEFIKMYPDRLHKSYKHSETVSKDDWLEDAKGKTILEIISDEVSHWEED